MNSRDFLLRPLLFYYITDQFAVLGSVLCPVQLTVQGNITQQPESHQSNVRLIQCSRGCCPDSGDGCCYRNSEDIIIYTVPTCVFLILIIVILCLIFKNLRDNRRRERLAQLKRERDNPPTYSSCVHPVSNPVSLALWEAQEMTVEVVVHPPAEEDGGNMDYLQPPPPVYHEIFKIGDEDKITVVSPNGHISFVDQHLMPAIKSSFSQSDLSGKLGDGLRPSRSDVSIARSEDTCCGGASTTSNVNNDLANDLGVMECNTGKVNQNTNDVNKAQVFFTIS